MAWLSPRWQRSWASLHPPYLQPLGGRWVLTSPIDYRFVPPYCTADSMVDGEVHPALQSVRGQKETLPCARGMEWAS